MINQYKVPALIEDAIPELRKPLHQFPVYVIYTLPMYSYAF